MSGAAAAIVASRHGVDLSVKQQFYAFFPVMGMIIVTMMIVYFIIHFILRRLRKKKVIHS